MTNDGLTKCIEMAKNVTSRAKQVKAWRLRKADKQLQSYDMPNGYIIATGSQICELLASAGKKTAMVGDNTKGVWALCASMPNRRGIVSIDFMPIAISAK